LLDVSTRSNKPGSAFIYTDGADARLLRKLISALGSEEKAQNAIILMGFLTKLEKKSDHASSARAKRVRDNFEDLVGMPFQEFERFLADI